ncbi:hypothetical protein GCM10020331_102410 [Ectobacillus funiculus]
MALIVFGAGLSGVYVIASNQLGEQDKALLRAVARIELRAGGASLATQMRLPKVGTENELQKVETTSELPKQLIPFPSATDKSFFLLDKQSKKKRKNGYF